MRPKAEWAIDSEAMRASGIIVNYSHGVPKKSTRNRSRTFYRLVTSPDAVPLRYSALSRS